MHSLPTATIYAAAGRSTIIAARHYNAAGILYEQANPAVVACGDWNEVASQLREALKRFSFQERNLREVRLKDWPSYQASGLSSVSQFERHYLPIQVSALNEAELFYEASAKPQGEDDLTFRVSLNRYRDDEAMGLLLRKLFESCLKWSAIEFG